MADANEEKKTNKLVLVIIIVIAVLTAAGIAVVKSQTDKTDTPATESNTQTEVIESHDESVPHTH